MKNTEVIIFPNDSGIPIISFSINVPDTYEFTCNSGKSVSARHVFRIELNGNEKSIRLFESVVDRSVKKLSDNGILDFTVNSNVDIMTYNTGSQAYAYVPDKSEVSKIEQENANCSSVKIWTYGNYDTSEITYISFMYLIGSFFD